MDEATKRLLTEARDEILSLRRRNEILSAKVEMIDLFATVLHTRPAGQCMGMGEDVAWKIEHAIADAAAQENLDRVREALVGGPQAQGGAGVEQRGYHGPTEAPARTRDPLPVL